MSRRLLVLACLLGATPVLSGAPPDAASLARAVEAELAAVMPPVVALRRELHRHPELANHEVETARRVAARLRELGVDRVRTDVAPTGVVAEVDKLFTQRFDALVSSLEIGKPRRGPGGGHGGTGHGGGRKPRHLH